jgi:hypothetical protein
MPSSVFGVLRHGTRIESLRSNSSVDTGITYGIQLPGAVPFFEEYDAMIEANYNQEQWNGLRPWQRAEAVAHFRVKRHIGLHEAEALDTHFRSKRPKK